MSICLLYPKASSLQISDRLDQYSPRKAARARARVKEPEIMAIFPKTGDFCLKMPKFGQKMLRNSFLVFYNSESN